MFKNLSSMMEKAKQMKENIERVKEELKTVEVIGVSFQNFVEVKMNGEQKVMDVKIISSAIDNADTLSEYVKEATNDAISKVNIEKQALMKKYVGDIPLPTEMLPF